MKVADKLETIICYDTFAQLSKVSHTSNDITLEMR